MLRAYDYTEKSLNNTYMHDDSLFREEKRIAQEFVLMHPLKNEGKGACPICGSYKSRFVFARWDIDYRMCCKCKSIYVPTQKEVIEEYLNLEEMKKFREADAFQDSMSSRRTRYWSDFVSWLKYRTYRYLGNNTDISILDIGNKYKGMIERIGDSDNNWNYKYIDFSSDCPRDSSEKADVALYLNQLQHEANPIESLKRIRNALKEGGLLVLNTRLGSGFDILTLKGGAEDIFPYEHITLPSREGLQMILEKAGFKLLEITTPGTRDMDIVLKNKDRIDEENFFVKYLLDTADNRTLADFQQFLQKSGLSSFAQIVAMKESANG